MCNAMLQLVARWKRVSEKTLVKLLLRFNENSKLFLASYFYRFANDDMDDCCLDVILECLLRLFTVLELVDSGFSSKYFKTFLFGVQVKFIDPFISEKEIQKDFDAHIRANWDRNKIKEALQYYNGNLLVYLNEYLFAKEKSRTLQFGPKIDVEHIMPNSGNNLPEIRSDAGIRNVDEFFGYVNKLGNKIVWKSGLIAQLETSGFERKYQRLLAIRPDTSTVLIQLRNIWLIPTASSKSPIGQKRIFLPPQQLPLKESQDSFSMI